MRVLAACSTTVRGLVGACKTFRMMAVALMALALVAAPPIACGDVIIPSNTSSSNDQPTSIDGSLDVYGTYTANASLSLPSGYVYVHSGGNFNMNASVSAGGQLYNYGGVVHLNSGTFSSASGMYVSSPIVQNGGHYVTAGLALYDSTALTYGPGDFIDSTVAAFSNSVLTANKPLLNIWSFSLGSVGNHGNLVLTNWSESWNGLPVAMSLFANYVSISTLEGYRDSGWLQFVNAPGPVAFQFDPISNKIFVTADPSAVPEIDPAGFGSVAALLTGALGLIERRRLKAKAA